MGTYFTAYFGLKEIIDSILIIVFLIHGIVNAYISTDEHAIHTFLQKRLESPYYRFLYSLTNHDDKGVIESYRKLVTIKTNKKNYAYFTVLFSFYFNNMKGMEDEINKLKSPQYRLYYQTLFLLKKEGPFVKAQPLMNMKRKWMKESIFAEQAEMLGQMEEAQLHAKKAIHAARGFQYYQLKKYYWGKYGI
ncbi:hypothetical protein [Niallia sp. 01092]|uniref:hypothetical protein n=1 Tax=unclassified Niallia TaxID=2837522 RepID=UPI003FD544F1